MSWNATVSILPENSPLSARYNFTIANNGHSDFVCEEVTGCYESWRSFMHPGSNISIAAANIDGGDTYFITFDFQTFITSNFSSFVNNSMSKKN